MAPWGDYKLNHAHVRGRRGDWADGMWEKPDSVSYDTLMGIPFLKITQISPGIQLNNYLTVYYYFIFYLQYILLLLSGVHLSAFTSVWSQVKQSSSVSACFY